MSKTSNWAKAPICAAFVKEMREVFGSDVKVLWVKEGELEIGEPCKKVAWLGPLAGTDESTKVGRYRGKKHRTG